MSRDHATAGERNNLEFHVTGRSPTWAVLLRMARQAIGHSGKTRGRARRGSAHPLLP
jgi:hypothetical protein